MKRQNKMESMITDGEKGSKENNSEIVSKKFKGDSFSIQNPEDKNESSVSKKKKRKRKKPNNPNQDLDGKISSLEVNDEPNPKRLKKNVGCVDQVSLIEVASTAETVSENISLKKKKKKKKKKGGMCIKEVKPTETDNKLSLIDMPSSSTTKADAGENLEYSVTNCNGNSTETGKKKKKKKRKKKKSVGSGDSEGLPVNLENVENEETKPNTVLKKKKPKKKKKKGGMCIKDAKPTETDNKLSSIHMPSSSTTRADASENLEYSVTNCNGNSTETAKKKKKKRKKKKSMGSGDSEGLPGNLENVENEETKPNTVLKKKKPKKKKKKKSNISSLVSNENIKESSKIIECDKLPKLNSLYDDKTSVEDLTKCWKLQTYHKKENGFELLAEPFRCAYIPDFLQDSNFLQKVVEELSEIQLIKKNNDLYKFHQTPDLKNVSSPYISSLRTFLYGDFRKWLSDVTGIELNDTVDMGSSRYEYTDVLLCHDDELEGRRIAYILYLVPEWNNVDGGMLDLFDTDQNGLPNAVVKSLVPKWNTFAFFEVSPVSFHQVNEVLSRDRVRLSINGWFHGSDIKRPPKYVEPPRKVLSPVYIEQDELYSWINPSYLDMDTQRKIRKKFQRDSEIELESFLCDEKYEELTAALESNDLKWLKMGPANKQACKILKQNKLPEVIQKCLKFFQSEAMFLILSQLTGLELHRLAPPDSDPDSDEEVNKKDSNPGMVVDIRKWNHGCYTLIRDGQGYNTSALDAMYFLHVANKWNLEHGGFTSYIAKDEDEELLTVVPHSNCLALVYCDTDSLRFTKYVNDSVKDLGDQNSYFYDVSCTYFQQV